MMSWKECGREQYHTNTLCGEAEEDQGRPPESWSLVTDVNQEPVESEAGVSALDFNVV
jgi:hypothetical protein